MDRRHFLSAMAGLAPLTTMANPFLKTKMPVLFLAHGHPYNGMVRKRYGQMLHTMGQRLYPRPRAILVISAHWASHSGSYILSSAQPKTLHDFQGLPPEYYRVEYPAPGSPEMARHTEALLDPYAVMREDWGFDQGSWILLRNMYPEANIPVYQLSLDVYKQGDYHYLLGKMLEPLRSHGVLIIGSGNIVNNPARVENKAESPQASQRWAQEFMKTVSGHLYKRNDEALINFSMLENAKLAIPTPEHFLPLLYVLGATRGDGSPKMLYNTFQEGITAMHSWRFG